MGLGDNRRSPKMRRKMAQVRLKARLKRKRDAAHTARAATQKTPAKPEKKSK